MKHPIRLWREKCGQSQKFLADRLGCAPATLCRIEKWQKRPGPYLAQCIAHFTGLTIEEVRAKPDAQP
jgi:DNA-binding XRE family transcriptional regulator